MKCIGNKVFPNCICLLDYFHLSQDFHKKMNEVRIKVMKGYKDDKASDEYYLLKKFNWLLFKNPEDEDKHGRLFDVERERKYNSHFKSYMNYYDLRKKLLETNYLLLIKTRTCRLLFKIYNRQCESESRNSDSQLH